MDFAEQIRVLQAAAGDPARLALASIDLTFARLADGERAALKETLEAVAIPHWYDDAFLATLLEITSEQSANRVIQLRDLTVTETFRARGPARLNVHQAARVAIRKQLQRDQQDKFRQLSGRAAAWFGTDHTSAGRIEWVYHLLCADPDRGADECRALDQEWNDLGQPGDRYALALALNELETSGLVAGAARAQALACINEARAAIGHNIQGFSDSTAPPAKAPIQGAQIDDASERAAAPTPARRFAVALSYASEQRPYVRKVVWALREELARTAIFYDKFYKAELVGLNLDSKLERIYHDDAELIVVFVSAEYETKQWCGLEWRAIRDIIKRRRDQDIVPLRFDDTEVPGLFSVDAYIDLKERDPEEVADIIFDRLKLIRNGPG